MAMREAEIDIIKARARKGLEEDRKRWLGR